VGVSPWPAGQLVHWAGLPLQVAQAASQAAQLRSALAWQAMFWYWPAGQVVEQATQVPPERYVSGAHTEHCWSLALVQTMLAAHPGTGPQAGQVSAVSLAR
jgi:hypothetical protein